MSRKHSLKEKEKIRKSMLKYYSDSKNLTKFRKIWKNDSYRKKISSSLKKYFSNPSSRIKLSDSKKKYYKTHPNAIKEMDRAMTSWWHSHPNIKKQRSKQIKSLFLRNPEKFKKFLSYGSNPSLPRFRTKQGFKVRSRGEQTIANFLHDNKIKSSYETHPLLFPKEGHICVPDFYLPHYKTYIEFYGGFPAAWKKKVLKNRLYTKHKIKCIFITPGELRDLRKYLMREVKKNPNL